MIENKLYGLYYGNRLILPFQCIFLKIIINKDIIFDFSTGSKFITVAEGKNYTDLYFHQYDNIQETITEFESIKMVVVEKNKDIFDFENHIKLAIYFEKKHKLRIEKTDEDILFIE